MDWDSGFASSIQALEDFAEVPPPPQLPSKTRLTKKTRWEDTWFGSHGSLWPQASPCLKKPAKTVLKKTKQVLKKPGATQKKEPRPKPNPRHSLLKGPRCDWKGKPEPQFGPSFSQAFSRAAFQVLEEHGLLNTILHNLIALGQSHGSEGDLRIRIGTVCSGAELLLTILPCISELVKMHSGVSVQFCHLWSCEFDLTKCAWIKDNFGVGKIFLDITKMADDGGSAVYLRDTKEEPEEVDIMIGGTSCKDASRMNKMQAELRDVVVKAASSTGSTYAGFEAVVDKVRPRILILENVPGLKDKKKSTVPGCSGSSNFDAVKASLNKRGYAVCDRVFDAHQAVLYMLSKLHQSIALFETAQKVDVITISLGHGQYTT